MFDTTTRKQNQIINVLLQSCKDNTPKNKLNLT